MNASLVIRVRTHEREILIIDYSVYSTRERFLGRASTFDVTGLCGRGDNALRSASNPGASDISTFLVRVPFDTSKLCFNR